MVREQNRVATQRDRDTHNSVSCTSPPGISGRPRGNEALPLSVVA